MGFLAFKVSRLQTNVKIQAKNVVNTFIRACFFLKTTTAWATSRAKSSHLAAMVRALSLRIQTGACARAAPELLLLAGAPPVHMFQEPWNLKGHMRPPFFDLLPFCGF